MLTFTGGDQLYATRSRLWSDAVLARPMAWGARRGEEPKAFAAARALGVTHLLVDRRLASAPIDDLAIVGPAARACCLETIYAGDRFTLYALRDPPDRAAQQ